MSRLDEPSADLRGDRLPAAFGWAALLGAFLFFQVQLLLAKRLLPWFGGAPAVWVTCLLFFQGVLLVGYAYAHLLARALPPRVQALVHGALLTAALALLAWQGASWGSTLLPPVAWASPGGEPVARILIVLAASIGLPGVALAATAPLVQAWLARARPGVVPYRLYALSNLGSLLGLLSYVAVVEPSLPLAAQATVWSLLFVAWTVAMVLAGRAMPRAAIAGDADDRAASDAAPAPGAMRRLLWLGLAFAGSSCLLAVNNQICQELPVLPLFWAVPLAIYLVTYVLAFDHPAWRRRGLAGTLLVAATTGVCFVLYRQLDVPPMMQVLAFSAALFAWCLACHGELARLQPPTRFLTAYYLTIAAGGSLGGIFVAVVAPLRFRGPWELHASVFAACLSVALAVLEDRAAGSHRGRLGPAFAVLAVAALGAAWLIGSAVEKAAASGANATGANARQVFVVVAVLGVAFLAWRLRARDLPPRLAVGICSTLALALLTATLRIHAGALGAGVRFAARDFFAVVRVQEVGLQDERERAYWLLHGRIVHGFELAAVGRRDLPTAYYGRDSGVGLAIRHHPRRGLAPPAPLRIGDLGLGVGTIAAYGEPGDTLRFYEISPTVVQLARGDGGYFHYLADTRATVEIVTGDARVALADELRRGLAQAFDVLVVDAFTGGAVPVHLLTREAFELYLAHLAPGGVLAVNVSNRSLDLARVVWRLAAELRLHAVAIEAAGGEDGTTWNSRWMLISREVAPLAVPAIAARARTAPPRIEDAPLWTDEHSSLLGIVRWRAAYAAASD